MGTTGGQKVQMIMTRGVCADLRPGEKESRVQRRKYKRHTTGTYVGLLAYIIQDSPNKMLTFRQIMEKMGDFVSGDRKGLENNIRVCLSSNKCFVKVPVDPDYPNAKRNFWKVDESCITPKMQRRHFRDITAMMPSFIPRGQGKFQSGAVFDAPSPPCNSKENNQAVKFSSSFSIESLLKKDQSAPTPIPSVQNRAAPFNFRLSPAASRSVCWDGRFYDDTHLYYMHSSSVAGHSETPAVSSPLLSYDQTILNKLSSASQCSHDVRYLRW